MRESGTRTPALVAHTLQTLLKNKRLLLVLAVALIVLLLFALPLTVSSQSHRSATYKEVAGAAGLAATIDYDCPEPCEEKYNFNVYFFNERGQQVSVVRPNQKGQVNMALAEGKYVMLIGKKFNDDIFPQEPLELKNGQKLELKLMYR